MPASFDKPYNPKEVEPEIYAKWEKSGFFNPDNFPGTGNERFSMVLPPPNVTGTLHMGHALTTTIEDIIVRYQRMRGKKVLWVPGADHASIATETKFLREKKINRNDYQDRREEFIRMVSEYALRNQEIIVKQLRAMGASLDWSRFSFTLDEARKKAVLGAFKKMHEAGLIYYGEYLVNWDIKGQTTVSDDEIEYETERGLLYTFRYSKDFPIPIATTRPETKLGDTAVAVYPDGKWKKYIGEEYEIENFAGTKLLIKIVGDEAVDPEFGTGAVGITPMHSKDDWEIAERHKLDKKQVINEFGQIMGTGTEWDKKIKIKEAREKIVEWLRNENLLEKEETIEHNVAKAQRSGGVIEILPKRHQFFVSVNKPIPERGGKTLKDLMREAVESGAIKIVPEHFQKTYFHWIDNLRDWNISRQIWYGHLIPAWHKGNDVVVADSSPGEGWHRIKDTFDTWFSSGLWTFSALGWPDDTGDLKEFHPTDLLETGYDILFFWVARMILMSQFLLGEIPFRTIYLHGLVRDEQRRKMSKSLGNVIDPLVMTEKYGTDALRMALIFNTAPGTDSVISEQKIKGMKHFANKLWNIARFVLSNIKSGYDENFSAYTENDQKLRQETRALAMKITKDMDSYGLHLAAEEIYQYIWHTFADKIIEESKNIFKNGAPEEKISREQFLLHALIKILSVLHPFMPFITEQIWEEIPLTAGGKGKKLLMVEKWPAT